MLFKKILFWINFFLKVKIRFFNPKKSKVLIFDKENSYNNCKILNIKNYQILYARKEEFYLSLIILLVFKLKLNLLDYYILYIKKTNPKIVITFIDNNYIFYKLKQNFKDIKFISVQNGHRMSYGDIFGFLKKYSNIKNLSADIIFTFNKNISKEYNKKINANCIPIGSLKNNYIKLISKTTLRKNTLVFISAYRPIMTKLLYNNCFDDIENKFGKKYPYKYRQKINFTLPKILKNFCDKKNFKFFILGATNQEKEKFFYDTILGKGYKFIKKKNIFSNYKELDKHYLAVSTYSTLGYEAFARGKKICFFSPQISKYEKSYCFGWPYVKNRKGFFYSDDISYKSVSKILENVRNLKDNLWKKKINLYKKNIMVYDKSNFTIKKIIHQIC